MKLIDMHCDTIGTIYSKDSNINLRENNLHVDLEKLKNANSKAQFFALYLDSKHAKTIKQKPFKYFNQMLDLFYRELEENKEIISLAKNHSDMEQNEKDNKISAFLTIEDGAVLEGDLDKLEDVYNKGVRLITLTWNFKNELGFPNSRKKFMTKGLTLKGIEVVEKMNELGMLIDVSHLSDCGFYDVLKYSKTPFVASHSNARAITNHPRNLTDKMIKSLAEKGGVIGLNFCTQFLTSDEITKVSDIANHLKYVKNIGGIDVIGLGADFDGIDSKLEIENIGEMDKLLSKLQKIGFSENEIEKIWHGNVERVIKDVLK